MPIDTRKKPAIVLLIIVSVTFMTAFLEGEKYPPFIWITRLQLKLLGRAYSQITLLFGFVLIIGALAVLAMTYRKLRNGRWLPEKPTTDGGNTRNIQPAQSPAAFEFKRVQPVVLVAALLGLVMSGIGIHGLYTAHTNREKVTFGIEQVYAGQQPASAWVSLKGQPQLSLMLETEENHTHYIYIPLVPTDWRQTHGISLVMRLRVSEMDSAMQQAEARQFEGMLKGSNLEAIVEEGFRETGVALNSGYRVLELGRTPEHAMGMARSALPFGGGAFAVSLGAWLWGRRTKAIRATAGPAAELKVRRVLTGDSAGKSNAQPVPPQPPVPPQQ